MQIFLSSRENSAIFFWNHKKPMLIYYTQTYLPPYILYYHYCYMSSKQSNVKDKNERKNTHPKPFLIKVYRYHFIREWIKKPIVDVANKKKFSKNKKRSLVVELIKQDNMLWNIFGILFLS